MDIRVIIVALVTIIGAITVLPAQQQQLVLALNPCDFADPSYDYNSTGSYTSGVEECNDFFYPEDRAGNRDYRTYEDPPVTAQEYGEFPLVGSSNDNSDDDNDDKSNDNNNEDTDPQVQEQIDSADSWLRYFNEGQMWNCPVGDVDCTIFGQNSPGSFTCQYLGKCDENAGGLPSGYPYTQDDIDETNQKADEAIAGANRLLECLQSGTVC